MSAAEGDGTHRFWLTQDRSYNASRAYLRVSFFGSSRACDGTAASLGSYQTLVICRTNPCPPFFEVAGAIPAGTVDAVLTRGADDQVGIDYVPFPYCDCDFTVNPLPFTLTIAGA